MMPTDHWHSLQWQQPWLSLPEQFYQQLLPVPLENTYLIHCNAQAGKLLGLPNTMTMGQALLACANNTDLPLHSSVASVYGGHQFGIYTSQLGDGRALSLGQVQARNGNRFDIQLKGGGLTAYSRTLDGRLPLTSAIKEFLGSEALSGLGVPTTRSLALLGSQSLITRDQQQVPAAILIRMARSHMRFGHLEYFHHRDQAADLKILVNHIIETLFPQLLNLPSTNRPLALLETVTQRTAHLIAHWQSVGFTHGVINTDNMTLLGDTIDFGPFGFMETFDPALSANPNDDLQRYQFDQQPEIGRWNCMALAEALSTLLPNKAIPARLLRFFRHQYQNHYLQLMRGKLGLYLHHPDDQDLIKSLLLTLHLNQIDYTLFFRQLANIDQTEKKNTLLSLTSLPPQPLEAWLNRYHHRLALEMVPTDIRRQRMSQANPVYVLRDHILQQVCAKAIQGDFSEFKRVLALVQQPFYQQVGMERYQMPAPAAESAFKMAG